MAYSMVKQDIFTENWQGTIMTEGRKIGKNILMGMKQIICENPFLFGLAYSYGLFLFVCIVAHPCWEGADEFLISGILSGITGESSPYVLVISYPLSCVLYLLEIWLPQLNWLTMLEIFSVWISFAVYIWIFLNKKSIGGYLTAFFTPLVFETAFFMSLHYTRSACLLTFTGLLLIYYCCFERPGKPGMIAGGVLMMLGSLMRYSCTFLVIPFVGIWVVICGWRQFKEKNFEAKENVRFISFFIGTFIIIIGLNCWHKYEYEKFTLESDYVAFNRARSFAYDYLPENYQIYEEAFEKAGISFNDYEMLRTSTIYDSFFDIDTYSAISGINTSENKSLSQKWNAVKARLWKSFSYYNSGRISGEKNMCVLFLIVACLSLTLLSRKSVFAYFCTLLGTLVIAFYFIWTGRFPPWVQDSLYFIGCITFLYGIEWKSVRMNKGNKKRRIAAYMICGALVLSGLCFSGDRFRTGAAVKPGTDMQQALSFMENDKNNVYLIDNFSYCPYPIIDVYGSLRGLKRGSWSNILRVGTWFIDHPVLNHQLEDLALESPIRDMVNDRMFLFTNIDSPNIRKYQIFFEEHYGTNIRSKLVHQWGGYAIYSFELT